MNRIAQMLRGIRRAGQGTGIVTDLLKAGFAPAKAAARAATSEPVSKAMFNASFAPLAMVGHGVMSVGSGLVRMGDGAARNIGQMALKSARASVVTSGGRIAGAKRLANGGIRISLKHKKSLHTAAAIGLGLAGVGLTSRASLNWAAKAKREQSSRDPANTMGLTLSQHYAQRR